MNTTTRLASILTATALLASAVPLHAQAVLGTDNASASEYAFGWTNGSDGSITGPGAYGQWFLVGSPGADLGFQITNVTTLGITNTALNSSGVSFGMFANTNAGSYADAYRFIDPAGLGAGQTFSLQLAVNFRNGNKRFDLRGATLGDPTIFNLNIGGDDYVVNNAATGNGSIGNAYSADTLFTLSFSQTDTNGGTWSLARSGGVVSSTNGTYTGVARSFKLYVGGTDNSAGENYLFANNLSTVPEPSTYALLLLGGAAAWAWRRRSARP